MPGSYPLSSNNWNNGVGWIGPNTTRSSASNSFTLRRVSLPYLSSAGSQRSELNRLLVIGSVGPDALRSQRPPLGSARYQTGIGGKRQLWHGQRSRKYAHALTIQDLAFAGDPVHGIRPHFGDRHPQAERIAQFNPVHEDDVVHQRTHGEVAHHGIHPQHFGVLMVVHGDDLMFLHQGHQAVEEIAKDPSLGAEVGAIGGKAVDDDPLGLELLYQLFDVMEMHIDLDFLGRLILHAHEVALDLGWQVDAHASGISHHLFDLLVEREHQAALATPRPFRDELQTHHALAYT